MNCPRSNMTPRVKTSATSRSPTTERSRDYTSIFFYILFGQVYNDVVQVRLGVR